MELKFMDRSVLASQLMMEIAVVVGPDGIAPRKT